MILTAGRSGSNVLYSALRSHPDVLCFGEILEEPEREELTDKALTLRQRRPCETALAYVAQTVFRSCPARYTAIGFKLKYYHAEDNDLPYYLRDTGTRIIHSRRRNVVAQALSMALAQEHGFTSVRGDPARNGEYRRAVQADPAALVEWIHYTSRSATYFEAIFRPLVPVLDVYYDDFCRTDERGHLTNASCVTRVLNFLGAAPHMLRTNLVKQRQRSYRELVLNYESFRDSVLRLRPDLLLHFEELESGSSVIY